MRIFFTLVLGVMLPSMTFGADGQSRPEVRNFLYQGPDGRGYGFYEITSPLYGHRSVIVIANRQFRVPFRMTRALIVSGVTGILIIGGAGMASSPPLTFTSCERGLTMRCSERPTRFAFHLHRSSPAPVALSRALPGRR